MATIMFTVTQGVTNNTGAPVSPCTRSRACGGTTSRRPPDTTSCTRARSACWTGRLQDPSYATVKTDAAKHDGVAQTEPSTGGWLGITDKYWLTAIVPDQTMAGHRRFPAHGKARDRARPLPGRL